MVSVNCDFVFSGMIGLVVDGCFGGCVFPVDIDFQAVGRGLVLLGGQGNLYSYCFCVFSICCRNISAIVLEIWDPMEMPFSG